MMDPIIGAAEIIDQLKEKLETANKRLETANKKLEEAMAALDSALQFIGDIAWNPSVGNNAVYYAREYRVAGGLGLDDESYYWRSRDY